MNHSRRYLAALTLLLLGACRGRLSNPGPEYSELEVGPNGAAQLGGRSGDLLVAIHRADVLGPVVDSVEALEARTGSSPRCTRYFDYGSRVVVWPSPVCMAGPMGKQLDTVVLYVFDRADPSFRQRIVWRNEKDFNVVSRR